MEKLHASVLQGKPVKIQLKGGKTMIGTLPIQSNNQEFEKNNIAFLRWDRLDDFQKHFNGKQKATPQELNKFLDFIKRSDIESFEVLENELSAINIEHGKPVPDWLQLQVYNTPKPGHLQVKYKIPDNPKWFEIGELQIRDGQITLPLTLAFLSYGKEDKEEVKTIMSNLHDHGVLTWFDEKNLLPGDDWEEKIEEAIEKSDYVLVFLSSKTVGKTGYKNKEINYALEQHSQRPSGKRYIIPILLDDCTPPRAFKKIQWLKATEENWFHKLLRALGKFPTPQSND